MNHNISVLNALRALAAFWVITAHCVIWGGAATSIPLPSPKTAVDIFIVLSGFLMSYTVTAREPRESMSSKKNWLRFYIRRFFRLAPAYYLSLALAVLLAADFLGGYSLLRGLNPAFWQGDVVYDPANTRYTATNILLHVSFLFGFHPTYSFSTFLPDWSIGLEMQFYLAFPAIFLAMRRFGAGYVCLVLAAVSFALERALAQGATAETIPAFYEPSLLVFRLPIFLAGMLLFEAGRTTDRSVRTAYALLALVFCAQMGRSYGLDVLWLLGAVALMAACVIPGREPRRRLHILDRVCGTRAVTFMSDVSYSVYLFHGFFLAIVGSRVGLAAHAMGLSLNVGTLGIWLAVVPLTYAFAYATYRIVELPGMRLGSALCGSRAVPKTAAGR